MEWVDRLARGHERHVREAFARSLERGGSLRSEYPPGTLAGSVRQILVVAEWRAPSRGPSELVRG